MKTKGIVISPWITIDGHCATRVIKGTDPEEIKNRVAFIEKSPRIRIGEMSKEAQKDWSLDSPNWKYASHLGSGDECGLYKPSREWCDKQLIEMGYILEN